MNKRISTSFAIILIVAWAGFFIAILWLNNKSKDDKANKISIGASLVDSSDERIGYDELEQFDRQDPEESALNKDRQAGYIKAVYEKKNKRYLDLDDIEWLTGEEAQKAKLEDGGCEQNEECLIENDYYIRNKDKKLKTLEISPEALIFMQTFNMEKEGIVWNREVEFDLFKNLFLSVSQNRYKDSIPFVVKIDDGTIAKITEQYMP